MKIGNREQGTEDNAERGMMNDECNSDSSLITQHSPFPASPTSPSSFILHPSSFPNIGFAREDEFDTVLEVMCAAFELPYQVARPVFYADPYFDAENKRVLRVDGKIVSCLTITSARCQVGKAVLPVAGISGVATLPKHQRKGYASRLIVETLHTLRERGVALAGLFPYDYAYYRRLGWETASVGCAFAIAPVSLPAYSEAAGVQIANPEHWSAIAALYNNSSESWTLRAIRDGKRWRYVQDRVASACVYVHAAETGETVEGYLLYDIQPGRVQIGATDVEQPPVLRVMEFCASTLRARRGLLGHLALQRQVGRIEYVTTPQQLEAVGLMGLCCPKGIDEPFAQITLTPSLMLRAVDFAQILESLRVNWDGFEGEILLTLKDELLAPDSASVLISGDGMGLPNVVNVSETSAGERLPGAYNPASLRNQVTAKNKAEIARVEGNVGAWSQVLVGHISGDEACAMGCLQASAPVATALAGQLFPARFPFLPIPDHF